MKIAKKFRSGFHLFLVRIVPLESLPLREFLALVGLKFASEKPIAGDPRLQRTA